MAITPIQYSNKSALNAPGIPANQQWQAADANEVKEVVNNLVSAFNQIEASNVVLGSGAPQAAIGADGMYYLDLAQWMVYGPKAAGAWPTPGVQINIMKSGNSVVQLDASNATIDAANVILRNVSGGNAGYIQVLATGSIVIGDYTSNAAIEVITTGDSQPPTIRLILPVHDSQNPAQNAQEIVGITADGYLVRYPIPSGGSVDVDDATIEDNGGSLRVKAGGIGVNQLANKAVTLDKMADGTAGTILEYDTNGRPNEVSPLKANQAGLQDRDPFFWDGNNGYLVRDPAKTVSATSGNVGAIELDSMVGSLYGWPAVHTQSSIVIDPSKALKNGQATIRVQAAAKVSVTGAITLLETGDFSGWSSTLVNVIKLKVIDPTGTPTVQMTYLGSEAAAAVAPSFAFYEIGTANGGSGSATQIVSNGDEFGSAANDSIAALLAPVTGDFTLTVRLVNWTLDPAASVFNFARFGVMFRQTTASDSIHISQAWRNGGGSPKVQLIERLTAGQGANEGGAVNEGAFPQWMRLSRSGSTFTVEIGDSEAALAVAVSGTLSSNADGFAGVFVHSTDLSHYATVDFDSLSLVY